MSSDSGLYVSCACRLSGQYLPLSHGRQRDVSATPRMEGGPLAYGCGIVQGSDSLGIKASKTVLLIIRQIEHAVIDI